MITPTQIHRLIIHAIKDDIRWHKQRNNGDMVSPEYKEGFIKGLEQGLFFVNKVHEIYLEEKRNVP